MSFRALSLGLGLCLALTSVPVLAGDAEVFTVSTLSQARSKAGDDRLALVFLTDGTSADCTYMESEAWTHPDVRGWVASHAVAAKVDTRSFHGAKLQGDYGIDTVPALLAFHRGTLARQHEGPLDGDKLLAWLEVVRVGDVQAADLILEAQAPSRTGGGTIDVEARIVDALEAPNPAAAAATLMSAWRETVGTPQQATRRPRLLEALQPYMINEGARDVVKRERDAALGRFRRQKEQADLIDWMSLNTAVGEDQATLDWVRESRDDKKGREALRQVLLDPQDPLLDLLAETSQWLTLGRIIGDPIELVGVRQRVLKDTKTTITGALSAADQQAHRKQLSSIIVGLLADGREQEARETSDYIRKADPNYGPVLVRLAIEAKQPRRWMRPLLNPNKADQVKLAMELTQELEMR